jgi:hypothetical protein
MRSSECKPPTHPHTHSPSAIRDFTLFLTIVTL